MVRTTAGGAGVWWDAVIAGAGPAGAACALLLARGGMRVLLLDRCGFPRDKACGDLLIPDSLAILARLGLADRVRALGRGLDRARVYSPSRIDWSIEGDFVTLRRKELDAVLVETAVAAGAILRKGDVVRVDDVAEGVTVGLRNGAEVRGRTAVLATGAEVSLLERTGALSRKAPTALAVRAYVRASRGPDELLISFDRSIVPGYGWVFPLPDGWFNVGVGVLHQARSDRRRSLRGLLDRFVGAFPPLQEMMASAGTLEDIRGARLRCGLEGARLNAGERILAVGEAVGTTYPFTGEGVGKAMETGALAAEAVLRASCPGGPTPVEWYARQVEEELRPRYRGYQAAQEWFARPLLNDLLAWRARKSPYLRQTAAEMVAEVSDPREAVSFRGLLRSFRS